MNEVTLRGHWHVPPITFYKVFPEMMGCFFTAGFHLNEIQIALNRGCHFCMIELLRPA